MDAARNVNACVPKLLLAAVTVAYILCECVDAMRATASESGCPLPPLPR